MHFADHHEMLYGACDDLSVACVLNLPNQSRCLATVGPPGILIGRDDVISPLPSVPS